MSTFFSTSLLLAQEWHCFAICLSVHLPTTIFLRSVSFAALYGAQHIACKSGKGGGERYIFHFFIFPPCPPYDMHCTCPQPPPPYIYPSHLYRTQMQSSLKPTVRPALSCLCISIPTATSLLLRPCHLLRPCRHIFTMHVHIY